MRRNRLSIFLSVATAVVAFATVLPASANAQEYNDDRIRLVIPFNPGGGSDAMGLRIQAIAPKYVDLPVELLHMPGGGGVIGTKHVAESRPSIPLPILVATNASIVLPPESAGYTAEDLDWLAQITEVPIAIVTPADSNLDFATVLEKGRQDPGSISAGVLTGGGAEVVSEMLADIVGGDAYRRVPYASVGDILLDVTGGHIDMGIVTLESAIEGERNGTMNMIAHSSAERIPDYPDVPTMSEVAGGDLEFGLDRLIFAQKGLPEESRQYLIDLFQNIVNDPEFREKIVEFGEVPVFRTGEELEKHLQRQIKILRPIYAKMKDK